MLTIKAIALWNSLKLGINNPFAWWDWKAPKRRQALQCKSRRDVCWLGRMRDWPAVHPGDSAVFGSMQCNVQQVWRTTIARMGEVEHTFIKAPQFGPLIPLFLRFAEVQVERAGLPLDKLQKSLSSFMDLCKETHVHLFSIVMDFHHQPFNTLLWLSLSQFSISHSWVTSLRLKMVTIFRQIHQEHWH